MNLGILIIAGDINEIAAVKEALSVSYFVYKMAAGGHFGCPKFTFDHISGHFR